MHLRQITPATIALLLSALVMVVVGTYTDNGGFQLAGVILLVVASITAFNQARKRRTP